MIKDFDFWNERKQYLHSKGCNLPYHEGEIWWCYLGVNIGSEEDGTGFNFERPVVIVRAFNYELCWAIPLTTVLKDNRYYADAGFFGGIKASAILSQMRPIDTKRLRELIGIIDERLLRLIKQNITALL